MKRYTLLLAALSLCAACFVYAEYLVSDHGTWPDTWPKELDKVRKQAQTYEGPMVPYLHYLIPFTERAEFEAAWPHLVKVKTKGAPIILVRGPKTDFFAIKPAGVVVHSPPAEKDQVAAPGQPIAGASDPRSRWINSTYIELVVDGNIVDLNRIPLPSDTPIIDERFNEPKK